MNCKCASCRLLGLPLGDIVMGGSLMIDGLPNAIILDVTMFRTSYPNYARNGLCQWYHFLVQHHARLKQNTAPLSARTTLWTADHANILDS